jgi:hypothetical protein
MSLREGDSVVIGAIIIATVEEPAISTALGIGEQHAVVKGPLGCVEIMGRSVVERMVERFLEADVECVSVLTDARVALPLLRQSWDRVAVDDVDDIGCGLSRTLTDYSERGIEFVFVAHANLYVECDLIDWIWFHRGTHKPITRACDRNGGLDFWVADCTRSQGVEIFLLPEEKKRFDGPSYSISGYVNQVTTPWDLRRLVTDVFRRRCEMRPPGKEIRPGVWVEAGARIHRRARIVAPAYIGRGAQVREDTLITRCSNLESSCYIDYGTVIEDSSILTNSYIGIWLDVTHAVVSGNKLANVGRNVVLNISDSNVIRENMAIAKESTRHSAMPASGRLQFASWD